MQLKQKNQAKKIAKKMLNVFMQMQTVICGLNVTKCNLEYIYELWIFRTGIFCMN